MEQNNFVICNIFNYKHDENAIKLYNLFKDSFYTTILDSFHKENSTRIENDADINVIYLDNVYFGGLAKKSYEIAKDRHSRWMLNITSDVEIDEENAKRLINIINEEIVDSDDIGSYFVSAKEGSSCYGTYVVTDVNEYLYNKGTNGLRDIICGEDWLAVTRTKNWHDVMSCYNDRYKIGWGIGLCVNDYAKRQGERIVIDDRVQAFHPYGTGYDTEEADKLYKEFIALYEYNRYYFKTNSGIETLIQKDASDKEKYVVLTCAKNEDNYLVEFVEHYLKLGFDKIIIADNNDKPTIVKVLDKYLNEGTVEIFNCRGFGSFQVQLYALFASVGNYKWCGYFDADEFLEIGAYSNVKDFLNTINENSVSFHWINYGANGEKHYKEKSLKERFTLPVCPILYFKENCFYKSILRGGDCWNGCWFNGSHIPYFENKEKQANVVYNIGGYTTSKKSIHCAYPLRYKCGYLKHYYTKSFDEWITKANRGWPDGTANLKSSTFFGFNQDNKFDFEMFKYAAFGENSDVYDDLVGHSEFYKSITDQYSVIELSNSDDLIYSLIVNAIALMKSTTNHTYIFTDEHIDDTLFAILLECALCTGNRAVYCRNRNEVWNTFLKYRNKNEETYYIISVL